MKKVLCLLERVRLVRARGEGSVAAWERRSAYVFLNAAESDLGGAEEGKKKKKKKGGNRGGTPRLQGLEGRKVFFFFFFIKGITGRYSSSEPRTSISHISLLYSFFSPWD